MSGYLWWLAEETAGQIFGWVGRNPEAASLIGVGLASPATRGFTWDLIKVVGREGLRSTLNITKGIGTSAITRSGIKNTRVYQWMAANPVTLGAAVATASAVGYVATADKHGAVPGVIMGGTGFNPGVDPGLVSGAESSDDAVRQYWGLPNLSVLPTALRFNL